MLPSCFLVPLNNNASEISRYMKMKCQSIANMLPMAGDRCSLNQQLIDSFNQRSEKLSGSMQLQHQTSLHRNDIR